MAHNIVEEFNAYRSKMNEKLLEDNNKILKRIFNLDTNAFTEGALPKKTKKYNIWEEGKTPESPINWVNAIWTINLNEIAQPFLQLPVTRARTGKF